MTHTPGPWTYNETTLSICRLIVSVEDVQAFKVSPISVQSHAIAYVPCDANREEQEANAKLIIAAPDLLAERDAALLQAQSLEAENRTMVEQLAQERSNVRQLLSTRDELQAVVRQMTMESK